MFRALITPKHPHKRGGRIESSRPDDRGRPARAECVISGDPERKPDSLNTYKLTRLVLLKIDHILLICKRGTFYNVTTQMNKGKRTHVSRVVSGGRDNILFT